MHEASLVAAMCAQIEDLARGEGARAVARVVVRLGALSGVEESAFRFAFEAYRRVNPLFREAVLVIEPEPVRRKCLACGGEFEAEPPCPACGAWQVLPLSGDALELARVELEI